MIKTKKLLVEGDTEVRVIPYLMEQNGVTWKVEDQPVVHIEPQGGVEEIMKPEVISSELKATGIEALGVLVDADEDAGKQWARIKNICTNHISGLPDQIPDEGLKIDLPQGPVFGVWIMPDNRYTGMLEDFLARLIKEDSRELFEYARDCVVEAKRKGANIRKNHVIKAEVHTWLAWQKNPGRQLHQAVNERILDPQKEASQQFVKWFRSLFKL